MSGRRRASAWALTLPALLIATLAAPSTAHAQTPSPAFPTPETSCLVMADVRAEPRVIEIGQTVDVGLTYTIRCPVYHYPIHVALLLDETDRVSDQDRTEMRAAVRDLLQGIGLPVSRPTMVSLIKLASEARTLCFMGQERAELLDCVHRWKPGGETLLSEGLRFTMQEMSRGRRMLPDPEAMREALVLFSNGTDDTGCGSIQRAAGQASANGILVITVCVGTDCDSECMRSVASSPRYHFNSEQTGRLAAVFEQLQRNIHPPLPGPYALELELPRSMAYVPGSANPLLSHRSEDPERLSFRTSFAPYEGVTVTFAVRPVVVGRGEILRSARLDYRNRGTLHSHAIRTPPPILVLPPGSLSSPTPTRTATRRPSATPTPTVTPTPQRRIFMPRSVRLVAPPP